MERTDLLVDRGDITSARTATTPHPDPRPGEVVVRVDRVALTANNLTYAHLGDALSYWQFFPAATDPGTWGRLPSWGVGHVVASSHAGVDEGMRLFGYLPVSTHVVLTPTRVTGSGFVDGSAHREGLAAAYQRYVAVGADETEEGLDLRAILDPLFATSRLLAGVASDDVDAGVQQVVLTSASSKTSVGAAWSLQQDEVAAAVVGVTSARNRVFVETLDLYDEVVTYDQVEALASVPTAVFDLAGSAGIVDRIHARLGDAIRTSWRVGATHLDQAPPGGERPGPDQRLFFAPAVGAERAAAGTLFDHEDGVQEAFLAWLGGHVTIERREGPDEVLDAYRSLLDTGGDPSRALVVSLHA